MSDFFLNKLNIFFGYWNRNTTTKFTEHPTVSKPISKFQTMADAMLKAAQAAYDGNDQYIAMLAEQIKAAKERKKILKEAVKREKAHYKEYQKTQKASAVSSVAGGGAAAAAASTVRVYKDTYQNRKLGRVGDEIPSRKLMRPKLMRYDGLGKPIK